MDLENVYQSVGWTELANNTRQSWAFLKSLIKFGVLYNSENVVSCATISFSGRTVFHGSSQ